MNLTIEQLQKLGEGVEIDALVHEYVLGLEVVRNVTAWTQEDWDCSDYPTVKNGYGTPYPTFLEPEPEYTEEGFRIGTITFSHPPYLTIPAYSKDLNLAWELLKQKSTGVPIKIFYKAGTSIDITGGHGRTASTTDDNLALDICKSLLYLKALVRENG